MGIKGYLLSAMVTVALLMPAAARAQDAPAGFVGGLGGVTFGTVSSAAVAGQGGVRIGPDLYLIGEFGYMRNVLPKEISDMVDDTAAELAVLLGESVDMSISVPARYGFAGLRWSPSTGSVTPFVEGGIGAGRISLKIDEALVGGVDVTSLIEQELEGEDTNTTELLFAVGGGITLRASNAVVVDVGYRFTRITVDDPAINASMIYGAVKLGF